MSMHWGEMKVMMMNRSIEECKVSVEWEGVNEMEKLIKYLREDN